MTTQGQAVTPDDEFETIYSSRGIKAMGLQLDFLPWDIHEPQPKFVELEQAGGFVSPVLDSGTGVGENSIYLASRGYQVTGVDGSSNAIDEAKERARAHGVEYPLLVSDVTSLEGLPTGFNSVLDWGLYHCLPAEHHRPYGAALRRVCAPGASWHLFVFTESTPDSLPMKWLRIGHDALRTALDGNWRIVSIEETTSTTTLTREILAQQRKNASSRGRGITFDPDLLGTDERGRILMPISHVHLERV